MRGRSYSYSPPVRGYGRRDRSPSPRGRYGGHGRDLPTSLLVRNLRRDCRPEDLRRPFEQFGPLKDVYLPRDYYTGEPRGFGFVQYVDPADAVEAKYEMDRKIILGRELTVVFAEENRKKPVEMRSRDRVRGRSYEYRRSSHDSRSTRYSGSLSPRYSRSRSRSYSPSPDFRSTRRWNHDRSTSPRGRRDRRERPYSRSRHYSRSWSRSSAEGRPRRASHRSRSPAEGRHPSDRSRHREMSESISE